MLNTLTKVKINIELTYTPLWVFLLTPLSLFGKFRKKAPLLLSKERGHPKNRFQSILYKPVSSVYFEWHINKIFIQLTGSDYREIREIKSFVGELLNHRKQRNDISSDCSTSQR